MLTTVWHLQPLNKCDVIGKFTANRTRVELKVEINFAPRSWWTQGILTLCSADMMMWP